MNEHNKLKEIREPDKKINSVLVETTEVEMENKKLVVGQKVKVNTFYIRNDVGGTKIINRKDVGNMEIEVLITETWYDYETGMHARGKLTNEELIKRVNEIGKTGYSPEHYKKYSEEMYKETLEANKNYNPSIALISEFDLEI